MSGRQVLVADLGEGPGGPGLPLFWVEKEEMIEGRKVSKASNPKPGPHLSSRTGSVSSNILCTLCRLRKSFGLCTP